MLAEGNISFFWGEGKKSAIKENILWFKKPSKYDKITGGFNLQNKRG
ncbi:hypothetical protein H8S00_00840 [Eubacterium sp. BX4]|uniref:Uncharacterized protein n=1 Tax=Eubacterium segne TaxID=2763045 RepID=A0ABR7EYY0_9FIRM|nr:hypothetical protein [Eubacterium segne]MBC5666549.1 hypothetical protein [Eubacterium segne]